MEIKTDWTIDCPTFLRLTSTTVGKHGMHVIEGGGVRSERTEVEITGDPFLSTEEAATLLEFIASASLIFPTTASTLIDWIGQQGGDFVLPPWFILAAKAETTAAATALLENAQAELRDTLEKAKARPPVSAEDNYLSLSETVSELEVIALLRERISSESKTATTYSRSDPLAVEIEAALRQIGSDAAATEVMRTLQTFVGKPGSCITDIKPGELLWRRDSGEPEKLTINILKARLTRRKRRLRHQAEADGTLKVR